LETLKGLDIVKQQFSNLLNSYTKSFNVMYDRKGKLFLRLLENKEIISDEYFKICLLYIHKNPVKDCFVKNLQDWKYSSYCAITENKNSKISKNEVINKFLNIEDFKQYHKNIVDDKLYDAIL